MRAITLWQPFASLVACGHKTVETRSWSPPRSLIGERIAIHAAGRPTQRSEMIAVSSCLPALSPINVTEPFPRGAVVATARLVEAGEVVFRSPTARAHWVSFRDGKAGHEAICACGDYSVGRWLWFLEDIECVDPPVPARGYQGWWEWTP